MLGKPLVYAITFVVCILLQAAIAPNIALFGAQPNFLLVPVLLVALRSGTGPASIAGFCLGVLYDAMTSGTIGCMALVLVLVAWVAGALSANIAADNVAVALVYAVVGALFTECLYAVSVLLTTTDSSGALGALVGHALPGFLYTAVFACIGLATITLAMGEGTSYQPRAGQGGGARKRPGGRKSGTPLDSRLH